MTWIILAAIGGFLVGWIVAFITLPTIVRALTGSPHPREVKQYMASRGVTHTSRQSHQWRFPVIIAARLDWA